MTEVHGADLTVTDPIDGNSQIGDAGRAYADAMDAHPDWYSARRS